MNKSRKEYQEDRQDRLEEQLRENLKKRKALKRAQDHKAVESSSSQSSVGKTDDGSLKP